MVFIAVALIVLVVGIIVVVNVARVFAMAARDASPRASGPSRSAEALVVDKRSQFSGDDTSTRQQYFVTFQLNDGNRVELEVPATESGILVVGDQGTLDWQGSRYLGFTRQIMR